MSENYTVGIYIRNDIDKLCDVPTEHRHGSSHNGLSFHHRKTVRYEDWCVKLKLIYDRQSAGQSVLVPGTHLGPATNFSFSLKFPLDSCWFVIL
jgi:hypothetical protein